MKFFVFNFCEKMKLGEGIEVVVFLLLLIFSEIRVSEFSSGTLKEKKFFHKGRPEKALKVLYFEQKLLKVSLTNLRKFEVASFF